MNKVDLIEVTGVSSRNKGAQLMFEAVRQYITSLPGPPNIAMAARFGSYQDRARYALLQKCDPPALSKAGLVLRFLPPALKRQWGLVEDADVDCILDASGFAFSDELGLQRVKQFARQVKRWHQQGKKVVLLPQALGPFSQADIRAEMQSVIQCVELIFARDAQSYAVTLELAKLVCPGEDKVRQAPDFTNLLEPAPTIRPGWPAKAFCIVPNIRMIEGARQGNAGAYLNFLLTGAKAAREAGLTPVVVLHVANGDEAFLEPLQAEFGGGLAVFQEDDPLQLKGLLRQAYMILGSRFHALANGLSQQVPCIACGWSHKYRALFEDYACAENVQPVTADEAVINRLILKLADPTAHAVAVEQLGHQSEQLKVQTRAMWTEVDRCLGVVRPDDPSVSGSEA